MADVIYDWTDGAQPPPSAVLTQQALTNLRERLDGAIAKVQIEKVKTRKELDYLECKVARLIELRDKIGMLEITAEEIEQIARAGL